MLLSLAVITLALAARIAPSLADASPTGRTVKEIGFSTGDAAPLGGFRVVQPGTWQEFNKLGIAVFTYSERARDDWSVYLHDAARNVDIQLDLHTRKVLYAASGQTPHPIYVIIFAMSDPPTGQTVTEVFTVATTDGGNATVTVNITGTNDVATLTSDTANLTEADAVLTTGGTLALVDLDATAATVVAQTKAATPAFTCTTAPPAKSSAPSWFNQPPPSHTQWATGA